MPPATAAATATATVTVTTAATAPGSAVVSAEQTVCAVSLSAVAARSYPSLDVIMSVDGSGIRGEGGERVCVHRVVGWRRSRGREQDPEQEQAREQDRGRAEHPRQRPRLRLRPQLLLRPRLRRFSY